MSNPKTGGFVPDPDSFVPEEDQRELAASTTGEGRRIAEEIDALLGRVNGRENLIQAIESLINAALAVEREKLTKASKEQSKEWTNIAIAEICAELETEGPPFDEWETAQIRKAIDKAINAALADEREKSEYWKNEAEIAREFIPGATGEWTPEGTAVLTGVAEDGDRLYFNCTNERSAKVAANAHNAALAAAYGQGHDDIFHGMDKENQQLRKQLAAEQRRADDSIVENVRLMNALAAEREKFRVEHEVQLSWKRQVSKFRKQLAAAQETAD